MRYECTCREWEERPCENPNEIPEVTCPVLSLIV